MRLSTSRRWTEQAIAPFAVPDPRGSGESAARAHRESEREVEEASSDDTTLAVESPHLCCQENPRDAPSLEASQLQPNRRSHVTNWPMPDTRGSRHPAEQRQTGAPALADEDARLRRFDHRLGGGAPGPTLFNGRLDRQTPSGNGPTTPEWPTCSDSR